MNSRRKAKINEGKHIHIMSLLTLLYRHPSEIQTDPLGSLNHLLCMSLIFSNIYVMLNLYRAFRFSSMPSLNHTWKFTYTKLQNDMNFYGCSCIFIHRDIYIKYLNFIAKLSYKNVVSSDVFFHFRGSKSKEAEKRRYSWVWYSDYFYSIHTHMLILSISCVHLCPQVVGLSLSPMLVSSFYSLSSVLRKSSRWDMFIIIVITVQKLHNFP